ncbi:MAG: hydroxymethylglutaryl-CoA lyase [Leptonema sp. (in: Bacteria)]|nr:hydroxymethylglutaryl-CoA lyase [Leptonema sp. (in: bacteria)]
MTNQVTIIEVGPRDGLQNESAAVDTDTKLKFIRSLANAGLTRIEATSFVRADRIPQLADAVELYKQLRTEQKENPTLKNVTFSTLVPNKKGMESAVECDVQEIAVFTAASDEFTQKNIGCSVNESFDRFADVVQIAKDHQIPIRGYVSTIIECPYSGKVKPQVVVDVCQRLLDIGCFEVSLGETIGVAVPNELSRLFDLLLKTIPADKLAGHYHDTRGTALSLVFRSLEYGLRKFDSSTGGLGGCPYAKGAAGNLATEDLVYSLERSGYSTGVSLPTLIEATRSLSESIGRKPTSRVWLSAS